MLAPQLRQQQATQTKDADRVAPRIVALLNTVAVHVAERLGESHAEESPTFALPCLTPKSVVARIVKHSEVQGLANQIRAVFALW